MKLDEKIIERVRNVSSVYEFVSKNNKHKRKNYSAHQE